MGGLPFGTSVDTGLLSLRLAINCQSFKCSCLLPPHHFGTSLAQANARAQVFHHVLRCLNVPRDVLLSTDETNCFDNDGTKWVILPDVTLLTGLAIMSVKADPVWITSERNPFSELLFKNASLSVH